jgi:phosphohistidine phosphatase
MRELLIVRHAIALDRLVSAEQGIDDTQRPLTEEGIKKMNQGALGLARLQTTYDSILSSPLLRAEQTARILQQHYPSAKLSLLETLAPPYRCGDLIQSLNKVQAEKIAIVGHEPGLSRLIAELIGSREYGTIELKKGGAALLGFDHNLAPGESVLRWLLTPKQLRLLGKS